MMANSIRGTFALDLGHEGMLVPEHPQRKGNRRG